MADSRKWIDRLFIPVDNAALVLFRVCFGFLLCCHCISYVWDGSLQAFFVEPPFTFNFIGFDFLQLLHGDTMYIIFAVMAALAVLILFGAWYRISMLLFAFLWTVVYLAQKVNYNNHYYLMVLLCWIMALLPAHRRFSIDAVRRPSLRSDHCATWIPWLFIVQMAIMYFFAGISKFDPDWINGTFIHIRFSKLAQHPRFGSIYANQFFQQFVTYSGIVFDLLIVPLLLWKRTRTFAVLFAIGFHLFNSYTFRIGIFPYLSIALMLFFAVPAGMKKLLSRTGSSALIDLPPPRIYKRTISCMLGVYLLIQLLLPMRWLLFPGNVFWTEEGYRMSWKMMLRTKSGWVNFTVKDPSTGEEWHIDPAKDLKPANMMWLSGSPDMIWQYAQKLKHDFAKMNRRNVQVFAVGQVSMNRRPYQPLVDPTVDLASIKWDPFRHSSWILPWRPNQK